MIKFIMERDSKNRYSSSGEFPMERLEMVLGEHADLQGVFYEFLNFLKACGYTIDPYAYLELNDSDNPDNKRINDLLEEVHVLKTQQSNREKNKDWTFPVAKTLDLDNCEGCKCCGDCEDE